MPALLRELKKHYAKSARAHLPWRKTHDPYRILVSEVMLQQTQVDRVVPYYTRFIKRYPTAKKLAQAPLSEVLREWQGLGYNRRGKYLWEAAKIISTSGWEQKLPGVGPYTAAAVRAFAHNKPAVFVETNIRTVFFHHQIHSKILKNTRISDQELLPLVAEALKKSRMQPREFYAALMDYGSHLKRQGVRLNSKSKHYAKQSKFKDSTRQLRGALLRELLEGPKTLRQLVKKLSPRGRGEIAGELTRLVTEGLLARSGQTYRVG